jgi:hypothetical protein
MKQYCSNIAMTTLGFLGIRKIFMRKFDYLERRDIIAVFTDSLNHNDFSNDRLVDDLVKRIDIDTTLDARVLAINFLNEAII